MVTNRPPSRRWSVIVCPRRGRPVSLQLLGPSRVRRCSCDDLRRPSPTVHPRDQDVARNRDLPTPRRSLRSFSYNGQPLAEPMSLPSTTHMWTAPQPSRVLPLKGHLSRIGGPLGPPEAPHAAHNSTKRPPPCASVPATPSEREEAPPAWLPTARRLLLEPAPRRLPVRSVPYGGPALRTQYSAFRRVEPSIPSPYYGGDVVYSMQVSVPLYGSLVMPQDLCLPAPPSLPAAASTAATPRSQVLRVLRPDELELKSPVKPLALQLEDAAEEKGAPESPEKAGKNGDVDDVVMDDKLASNKAPEAGVQDAEKRVNKRQWLLRIVRENFNEQIGLLVERFVRRPRHDKSVRRVPGIGRKVNVNLQDFWRRNSGQERHMKTKDLLTVYSDSGMDWRAFQKWLTKDLQFMPSCAKLCALSLDIYQKYWSTDWDDSGTTG